MNLRGELGHSITFMHKMLLICKSIKSESIYIYCKRSVNDNKWNCIKRFKKPLVLGTCPAKEGGWEEEIEGGKD